jgi:CP family cyanate transporter-like MFS transporter
MSAPAKMQSAARTDACEKRWLLVLGILFIGAVLRAPLTSVGPLAGSIRDSLGISNAMAGILTTLPLLAFALLSPFAPKLSRRFGMEPVLFAALALLTVGIGLRSLAGIGTLFLGTLLLGLAIAVCNVLLPGLIKREFSDKIGMMTGVYSVSMNLCGAIASGISVPIALELGLGWHGALGFWGILSIVSLLFWLPQMRSRRQPTAAAVSAKGTETVNLWRSGLAWQVTLFMGLQSLLFYTVIAWLPEIMKQQGLAADYSGWMLSLMQFSVLPFTFLVPIVAGRLANQQLLAAFTAALFFFGVLGVLYGSTALMPLWVIMMGIGAGSAFSLSMMFFGLRTRTAHQSAELSGMAQSFGYLLAAVGPTLFGYLHDATHGWTVPLHMLGAVAILLFIFGLGAGRNRYVS